MDAYSGLWQSFSCEARLPYVCKKLLNNTVELTGTFLTSSNKEVSELVLCTQVNPFQILISPFPSPYTTNAGKYLILTLWLDNTNYT